MCDFVNWATIVVSAHKPFNPLEWVASSFSYITSDQALRSRELKKWSQTKEISIVRQILHVSTSRNV